MISKFERITKNDGDVFSFNDDITILSKNKSSTLEYIFFLLTNSWSKSEIRINNTNIYLIKDGKKNKAKCSKLKWIHKIDKTKELILYINEMGISIYDPIIGVKNFPFDSIWRPTKYCNGLIRDVDFWHLGEFADGFEGRIFDHILKTFLNEDIKYYGRERFNISDSTTYPVYILNNKKFGFHSAYGKLRKAIEFSFVLTFLSSIHIDNSIMTGVERASDIIILFDNFANGFTKEWKGKSLELLRNSLIDLPFNSQVIIGTSNLVG